VADQCEVPPLGVLLKFKLMVKRSFPRLSIGKVCRERVQYGRGAGQWKWGVIHFLVAR